MHAPESFPGVTPVDPSKFVDAMRRAATTVAVVTTSGDAGRFGVTVSAMSSVSADPPSVLVCVNTGSPAADAIVRNGVFAVNLLSSSQHEVSDIFAGRHRIARQDHFRSPVWGVLLTGAPVLDDAVAIFDCRLATQMIFATHRILIGLVEQVVVASEAPLVHHDRSYCSVTPLRETRECNLEILDGLGWGV